jgi:hypothetical protein
MRSWALVLIILLTLTGNAHPQLTTAPQASVTVPHVIRYSGSVPLSVPAGQTELRVTFRLYSAARGGRALWQETQTITAQNGKIAALIGATAIGGIPDYWFASGSARWLEVQFDNEPIQTRVELASVPYALKAANAETLGGKPLSAFVLRGTVASANAAEPLDVTSYATLGANSFVGDQSVNGSVNVTGYLNTALATISTPLVVNQLLWVNGTATTGGVITVKAQNASSAGTGIMGIVTSPTGNTVGVIGRSDSVVGNGVYGVTTSPAGSAEAISGTAMANQGHGIGGYAISTTGNAIGAYGKSYSSQGSGVVGESNPSAGGYLTYGVAGYAHGNVGVGVLGTADSMAGSTIAVRGNVMSPSGTAGFFMNTGGGNILIGMNASANVFRVDGTGKVFADGGVQSSGADFAESVAVLGERTQYEPGDVLVIDDASDRQVKLSSQPYSTRVAGVYSTHPGTLSTPHAMGSTEFEHEIPMAVVGIVPCKVTALHGAIRRGDLLVASEIPGYAMKASDRSRIAGAIVGKAMQELREGSGLIEILITLE